jgi:acylphosphatase
MNKITVRVRITGRVQGVCYRSWTVEYATSLGLSGWVRNRIDGSVEAILYGN